MSLLGVRSRVDCTLGSQTCWLLTDLRLRKDGKILLWKSFYRGGRPCFSKTLCWGVVVLVMVILMERLMVRMMVLEKEE